MFGFVVVDDGVTADVGNGFVVLVDGGILGVDVGQVGAVVLVDVAVPRVVVNVIACCWELALQLVVMGDSGNCASFILIVDDKGTIVWCLLIVSG